MIRINVMNLIRRASFVAKVADFQRMAETPGELATLFHAD